MKRICFLILFVFGGLMIHAQDLDAINDMLAKSQFKEAKAAIDAYMAKPKNSSDAEGWYYKGRVYNAYSTDKTLPDSTVYNLKNDAFEAFKKNQALDSKEIRLKVEGYASYLDLYAGFYDLGANEFNKKNFEAAYNSFKKALEVKDYILKKQYTYTQITLQPLDTALVLNAAVAATQSKKVEEGVAYYRMLVDGNVSGKDYEAVYEYLVDYYSKKNDKASLQPIHEKAKKFYPENPFWTNVELRALEEKGDTAALYAKYDEMLEKNPSNFDLAYGYAVELYNSIIKKESKDPATVKQSEKLQSVLKIAIAADKGVDATVLMANHLFNTAADLLNAANLIKGTKPEDVKKKADLKAQANSKMDETITYADKATKYFEGLSTLKPMQKANYKVMLDHLSEIYGLKGNKTKVAEYEAKNKAVDKM